MCVGGGGGGGVDLDLNKGTSRFSKGKIKGISRV